MRSYRLMRVGEKCEVRIRFCGNPKQLERVRKATALLSQVGFYFPVCNSEEVGSWQASETYYARFRQLPSRGGDVGHRGNWGGSTLPAIRPNSPGLFGRIKSACCVWLVRHLIHLEYSRMSMLKKSSRWLLEKLAFHC